MKRCSVLVGGDICPTSADADVFCRGDAAGIFHDLLEEFAAADLTVTDLECPLTDRETPIQKVGPNLRAPTGCIAALRAAGIGLLDLANNHILDHGAAGLADTLSVAEAAGIPTVGAGRNLGEARRMFFRELQGVRLGILAMAQHEFTIAGPASPGANPLDVIDFVRNVTAERGKMDYLLVLLHAGNEYYAYPSPRLMDTCRFLIEQGANAVICHHTHCPGCWEAYRGGHIVYGQGNFVYDNPAGDASWHEGFMVRLSIDAASKAEMSLLPYEQSRGGVGVRKLQGAAAAAFLAGVAQRSAQIGSADFVRERWLEFCEGRRRSYFNFLFHYGRVRRLLCRARCFRKILHPAATLRRVGAFMRCEAHREVLETLIFPPDRGAPPS